MSVAMRSTPRRRDTRMPIGPVARRLAAAGGARLLAEPSAPPSRLPPLFRPQELLSLRSRQFAQPREQRAGVFRGDIGWQLGSPCKAWGRLAADHSSDDLVDGVRFDQYRRRHGSANTVADV